MKPNLEGNDQIDCNDVDESNRIQVCMYADVDPSSYQSIGRNLYGFLFVCMNAQTEFQTLTNILQAQADQRSEQI